MKGKAPERSEAEEAKVAAFKADWAKRLEKPVDDPIFHSQPHIHDEACWTEPPRRVATNQGPLWLQYCIRTRSYREVSAP